MSFIESLPSTCSSYFHSTWDAIESEFAEIAPFERGRWHWRSVIILVGIGCSLSAFVLSLFESSALLTILALAATAILCFAIYYVSRFEEQRRMALLLDDFEKNNENLESQVIHLSEQNTTLEITSTQLQTTSAHLSLQVETLTATQSDLQTSLETTKSTARELCENNASLSQSLSQVKRQEAQLKQEFERYKNANEEGSQKISANLESLERLDKQQRDKQNSLDSLQRRLRKDATELAAIKSEVQALSQIRADISSHVQSLKEQIQLLQHGISNGAVQQQTLQTLLEQLESLTTSPTSGQPRLPAVVH